MNNLPLLSWSPPCIIVPFPAARRLGKIRRTAEILSERHGKGAEQYWKQVVGGLRSQMEKSGLAAEVIESELRDFAGQVFAMVGQRFPIGDDAA